MDSAREWIALLLECADSLRAKGITSISINGHGATLSELPHVPAKDDSKPAEEQPEIVDPFQDPATYPGGIVPGFRIEKFETGE